MPRALVVERDTTELWVVLQRGCRPATAESVTLTITRVGSACLEPLSPCNDSCCPARPPISVMDCPPSKVYSASRIEPGLALFLLDQDTIKAPEGWYRAMIEVDGCEVEKMPLLVRYSEVAVCSYRVTFSYLPLAKYYTSKISSTRS